MSVDSDGDRSGVILVRAWLHQGQVVARIQALASGAEQHTVAVERGVDVIVDSVRAWLVGLSTAER